MAICYISSIIFYEIYISNIQVELLRGSQRWVDYGFIFGNLMLRN
jgi:hypothetical protein